MDFHPDKVLNCIEFLIRQKLEKKDAEHIWYLRHRLKSMGSICLADEIYLLNLFEHFEDFKKEKLTSHLV